MLISHRHKFAFIHVPKTAGSSVAFSLWRLRDQVDDYWANRWLARAGVRYNHLAPWPLKKFRTHTSADMLRRQLPADVFAGLFKFSFVRNPWDLMVSYWHYLRRPARQHHRRRLAERLPSFDAYVRYEIRRGKISQSRMLTDRQGRLLVDFVGRFETLETDFVRVCRGIGVDVELMQANRGEPRDYRDFYTPELADLVAEYFAADIELFGYAFENGGRQTAAVPARALQPAG
ncbi:MAG: sulfotransferase [Planctomycetota bacterium]|jgi:hypothetical protein|nr:MAG: sulfotransferase [Planctomycetota bacterium]